MGNELFFAVRTKDENGEITEKTAKFAELPCDTGYISDGYHTFDELYEHRCLLFCMLLTMVSHQDTLPMGWDLLAWKSLKHSDGSSIEGWFIAGIYIGGKQITYHLPLRMFNDLQSVETLATAPEWDGHTSQDVIERLKEWLKS
jgi:hypothetical protein